MGLDTVELIMEIEESFGIQITDAEAQKCRTVGDVYQLVLAKSPGLSPPVACLSRTAFYRLRSSMLPIIRQRRDEIRPRAMLDQVIPPEKRFTLWRKLESLLGHPLPSLQKNDYLSRWAHRAVYCLIASLLLGSAAVVIESPVAVACFAIAFASLFASLACIVGEVFFVTPNLLPVGVTTVGDLASSIKWHYRDESEASTRHAIDAASEAAWDKLVTIFCKQLGLKREQVAPEADIVRDFGL